MSMALSMANALSGLTAAAKSAETVSANVANVMTEGYGRREVILTSASAGVKVVGIDRIADASLSGDRRLAEAGVANAQTKADSLLRIEKQVGLPDEPGSLPTALASFDLSLIEAASQPGVQSRLQGVLRAAENVATSFNAISDKIQNERMMADQAIGLAVEQINSALEQVEELNSQIFKMNVLNRDTSTLQDNRQRVIDGIAELIPVKEVARDGGRVALFTPTGGVLIDGPAGTLGFSSTGLITPDMTLASGRLSGLTFNGNPVATGTTYSPVAGGRLAALFEIRDEIAPRAQSAVDAVAHNIIERFEDTALNPGPTGLFTDDQLPLGAAPEVGIAGRMSVNSLVDPDDPDGRIWRIRDGVAATSPGPVGDNQTLTAMSEALETSTAVAFGPLTAVARPASGLVGELISFISADRQTTESIATYEGARAETLTIQELEGGVDTDQEMQKLILVEQAYAANARVVQTIDELLQSLLRI